MADLPGHFRARSRGLVTKDVGDELVVFDSESNEAHLLNPTLAAVWRASAGGASRSELRAVLAPLIGVEDVLDEVLSNALADLDRVGLLDQDAPLLAEGTGISRRSLLKKAGIAAIALPTITTILAPPAAALHSSTPCLGPGVACSKSSDVHTVQCCATFTCETVGTSDRCCNKALGDPCSTTTDFCCEGVCGEGSTCCHSIGGGDCTSGNHNECCGNAVCNSVGACVACIRNGKPPPNADSSMCCSGKPLVGGNCVG